MKRIGRIEFDFFLSPARYSICARTPHDTHSKTRSILLYTHVSTRIVASTSRIHDETVLKPLVARFCKISSKFKTKLHRRRTRNKATLAKPVENTKPVDMENKKKTWQSGMKNWPICFSFRGKTIDQM